MQYQAFYSLSRTDQHVSNNAPVPVSSADAYTELFGGLDVRDDFFGLIDSEGTTLQAFYEPDGDTYWFEVPRPDLKGSFGASLSFDQAADLMKSLPEVFPIDGFERFEFQSW